MISKILQSIFGSRNQRALKRYQAVVKQIADMEASLKSMSDEALKSQTAKFKKCLSEGQTLDDILPEAFATVREVSVRTLGMRHFDVQLIGGMILHEGNIAEMSTGEGKTLVATLPAYLNALSGKPVHIVTVNPYLAQRDADWMAPIYTFLDLKVGAVVPDMPREAKLAAYNSDIIYATNNELGFDYLRDRMAYASDECVQGLLAFAIIDEVDSILIDEARTPLIISGPSEDSSELYLAINRLVPLLKVQIEGEEGDYSIDEKTKQVHLTESGHEHIERLLVNANLLPEGASLYDPKHLMLLHHVNAAIRAHAVFRRDVDYLIANQKIVIVDEHTGRTMPGRRWSEGLHQAIEAKEGVPIEAENQTLASITFQNFFRLYGKLSGMTGTADTEAYEFQQIYGLEVLVVPTNRPCQRDDMSDMIYLSTEEKYEAIVEDIKTRHEKGQPILVGTISIENSERLSACLSKAGIAHQVLNAKFHEKEAHIVAEAGRPGAVTIATNMAGRGTDIVLGGAHDAGSEDKADWQVRHDQVVALGGLHILGTERHESRRIDNQLRGRAGRQGDPGSSQFYLSLEDPLMRIFASDRVKSMMRMLGVKKGEAITHPIVSRSIENAQRKVEGHNFDIRKNLLHFDNVANDQRRVMYSERDAVVAADNIQEKIMEMFHSVVEELVFEHMPPEAISEQWTISALMKSLEDDFGMTAPIADWLEEDHALDAHGVVDKLLEMTKATYAQKSEHYGASIMQHVEKSILLHHLDFGWRNHLAAMDYLRQSIHLRGYAQKDPRQEYKREAFELFTDMLAQVRYQVVSTLLKAELQSEQAETQVEAIDTESRVFGNNLETHHQSVSELAANSDTAPEEKMRVGRNDPCPCGSSRKYKHCHGKL